jgi:hypothetical protein
LPFLIFFSILLLTAGGSAAGWIIFQRRLTSTQDNSPFSRLRGRISAYFSVRVEGGDSSHDDNSLVIVSAQYGAGNTWKDVVHLLQTRVQDGKLRIRADNAELGPDPLPNVTKRLEVAYSLDGRTNSKTVQENEILSLPEV